MPIKSDVAAKEAKFGERMIEIKVRFWTDAMAGKKGKVIPKHAWAAGVVRIERNQAHGITPGPALPFNSLLELNGVMEKALMQHGIVLHRSTKMKRYFAGE